MRQSEGEMRILRTVAFRLATGGARQEGMGCRDVGIFEMPAEAGEVRVEAWLEAGDRLRLFPLVGDGFPGWRMKNKGQPSIRYPGPGLAFLPVTRPGEKPRGALVCLRPEDPDALARRVDGDVGQWTHLQQHLRAFLEGLGRPAEPERRSLSNPAPTRVAMARRARGHASRPHELPRPRPALAAAREVEITNEETRMTKESRMTGIRNSRRSDAISRACPRGSGLVWSLVIGHSSFRAALLVLALFLAASQRGAAADARGPGLFEDYVKPLLQKRCYECHSHEAKKAKGGLVVDSRNGLLKGGDQGAAVVPGEPAESLLLKAISYTDPDLEMPPKGKLSADEIAHVREWIELGAPDPRTGPEIGGDTVAAKKGPSAADLWSVRPLQQTAVPLVKQGGWPRTDVDHFLLAAMEAKNLTPSRDAAPHTILRRLHEVLTGLPPTVAEVEAFVREVAGDNETIRQGDNETGPAPTASVSSSPHRMISWSSAKAQQALEAKVDELLASHHFGERWGRHWLDLARYADVSGSTVPEPFHSAWRYREYVLHAFNSDKPWERFVREQLAGDLLPSSNAREQAEQQIATGFLALGHVVAQDRDTEKLKLDAMDEHLDVLGKTFLGIQIGCARCHDHKIDPFPTREYYALAGILRSTRTLKAADVAQEHVVPEDVALAATDAADLPAWLRGGEGAKVHAAGESGAPRDEPIHLRGEQDKLGEVVPRGFPTLVKVSATKGIPPAASGRAELADWLLAEDNALVQRVIVNRVWHHVFGQGLVRSTDNFGLTGDAPSHPELFDFLSRRFREVHRGSFKSFIRELLLSRAFQQDSAVRADGMAVDPQNRLLWRTNVRRRDAETLIDSIRHVAGTLDLRPSEFNVPKFEAGNTGSTANVEIPGDVLQRRALYWPVFRKDVPIGMDILGIFDFPPATVPRGTRGSTRVPSQSLALLNAPMVLNAANALAASLPGGDDAARIEALYLRVLARRPTAEESAKAIAFLASFQAELAAQNAAREKTPRTVAWNRLCHVLLACNEFVTLE